MVLIVTIAIDIGLTILMDYLQNMGYKYEELGLALALTPDDICDIDENTVTYDNRQKLEKVLRVWQEKKTRPYTWETLLTILRALKETALADHIQRYQN